MESLPAEQSGGCKKQMGAGERGLMGLGVQGRGAQLGPCAHGPI